MHIAYSALRQPNENNKAANQNEECNLTTRYKAYMATCEKFKREITAIQKYLPGWQPAFNY